MADEQITATSTGIYLPEKEVAGEADSSREVIESKDKMLQEMRQYIVQQQALLAQQAAILAAAAKDQKAILAASQAAKEQCPDVVNRMSNCMDVFTPAAVNAATNKAEQDDELWIRTLIAVLIGRPMILMRVLKMCARVSWAHR